MIDRELDSQEDVSGSSADRFLPTTSKMTRSFSRSTLLASRVGRLTVVIGLLTVTFAAYIFLQGGRWGRGKFPLDSDGARYLARLGRHPMERLVDDGRPYRPLLLDSHSQSGLVLEDRQESLFRPNIPIDYYHPTRLDTQEQMVQISTQIEDLKSNASV